MTKCQQCDATLIADGLPQGQQVRCVKCAHLFRLGEEKKTSADRLAWRSFWLGLSSLLCMFFTGIPAIYYGIRSLLRMRFIKPRPKDRFAAVSGTLMGGCFGMSGAVIACFAAIIAITLTTVDNQVHRRKGRCITRKCSKMTCRPNCGLMRQSACSTRSTFLTLSIMRSRNNARLMSTSFITMRIFSPGEVKSSCNCVATG